MKNRKPSTYQPISVAILLFAVTVAGGCEATLPTGTEHSMPCGDVYCSAGNVCSVRENACVDAEEYCDRLQCGWGERCSRISGKCVDDPSFDNPCFSVSCDVPDTACFPGTGTCLAPGADLCGDVTCGNRQECQAETGRCVATDACLDVACNPWETCIEGQCVDAGCSGNVQCPDNMECLYGTCSRRSCEADYECAVAYPGACVEQKCVVPQCTFDGQCGDDQACVLGVCAAPQCEDPSECPGTDPVCYQGACVVPACREDADCGAGKACELFQCVRDGQFECFSDADCNSGDCVQHVCVTLY